MMFNFNFSELCVFLRCIWVSGKSVYVGCISEVVSGLAQVNITISMTEDFLLANSTPASSDYLAWVWGNFDPQLLVSSNCFMDFSTFREVSRSKVGFNNLFYLDMFGCPNNVYILSKLFVTESIVYGLGLGGSAIELFSSKLYTSLFLSWSNVFCNALTSNVLLSVSSSSAYAFFGLYRALASDAMSAAFIKLNSIVAIENDTYVCLFTFFFKGWMNWSEYFGWFSSSTSAMVAVRAAFFNQGSWTLSLYLVASIVDFFRKCFFVSTLSMGLSAVCFTCYLGRYLRGFVYEIITTSNSVNIGYFMSYLFMSEAHLCVLI